MVECLKCALVVMCAIGLAAASTTADNIQSGFFSLVDDVIKNANNLELTDGVSFVKTSEASPKSLNGNFGMLLLDRLNSFVNSHAIRVDLSEPEVEGRGKNKDKKMMKKTKNLLLPLILAVKAKMAILSAMVGNLIGIIAMKAILVSKIALIIGSMLFLKKLINNPPKEIKHEHIKHRKIILPTEEPEAHQIGNEWEKQAGDNELLNSNSYAQLMAYNAQKPIY